METFLAVFISVYFVMILAEFGDKTNIIALSLMGRNPPYFVALFSTIGIGISTVFAVMIGGWLGTTFPLQYIRYPAAVIFIWLGISTLRKDEMAKEENEDSYF